MEITEEQYEYLCDELVIKERPLEELCSYEKVFVFSYTFLLEVTNGGFEQFFYNFSGDYSQETLEALSEIGCNQVSELLDQAMAKFLDNSIPSEYKSRRKLMTELSLTNQSFIDLDQSFYELDDVIDNQLKIYSQKFLGDRLLPKVLLDLESEANEQFKLKNYQKVVDLLEPFEGHLKGSQQTKLKFSKKKINL